MVEIAGVSETTIYKYVRKLAKMEGSASVISLLPLNGRPRKYDEAVDAAFIVWLKDPERVYSEKMMPIMLKTYHRISNNLHIPVPAVTETALKKHIERLYQPLGYKMQTPKLVDAERCAILPTLKLWYEITVSRQ